MSWGSTKIPRKPIEVISTVGLAERWGLAAGTLVNWRNRRKGPPFIRLGSRVVYKISDIEEFERRMTVQIRDRR